MVAIRNLMNTKINTCEKYVSDEVYCSLARLIRVVYYVCDMDYNMTQTCKIIMIVLLIM